ncbi:MAG: restriction endonuclease subunit S [Saprospiraceae bacterium]
MTILELFKKVDPSVLAAKMIFKYLQEKHPVLKISDIADTSSGGTPSRGMIEYYNGEIPWVKSGELKDGLITTCDEYITESGLKNSSAKLFPKGTLLVAMYGANIGKTGVLDFDATTNQAVCAIFPKIDISKDFLFWYFKQQRIEFIAIGKGGAQPNISQTVINNAPIVVPDKHTQKLIVDFLVNIEQGKGIDESFFIPEVLKDVERIYKYKNSYIDLTDSFETQLTQLENLNQAILQEAVQGKLVAQDAADEPAIKLFKRIKAEKAASGKKEKPLPAIKAEEIPFEIPESWEWCRLGEICDNITKGSSPNWQGVRYVNKNEGILYITSKNVDSYNIDLTKATYVEEKFNEIEPRSILKKGDLLTNIVGASIGRTAIFELDVIANINQAVCILRIEHENINKAFLLNLMNSNLALKMMSDSSFAPGRANLSMGNISSFPIPLPPLSEQKRIVAEIERQLEKTKQLKAHIIANQLATEQLLKALLHGAFEVEEK